MLRLLPFALLPLFACNASAMPSTGVVEQFTLDSAVADDTYDILVRLPPGYDADAALYPVVYQLDATFLDELSATTGVVSKLETAAKIAPVIIVGIGHRKNPNPERGRLTDFVPPDPLAPKSTDRAPLFYGFLHDELAPKIEATYRVDARAGRTLIGHSLGGLFALYAFFQDEPDGTPFLRNASAADPSYGENDGVIYSYETVYAAQHPLRAGRLFLTASMFTGGSQKFSHEEMRKRIQRDFTQLELDATYERTTHGGLIPIAAEVGIPFVLGGGQ